MDRREFLQGASALSTSLVIPLPAIASTALQVNSRGSVPAAAVAVRGIRAKISPLAAAANRYYDRFGLVVPAHLSMEFSSQDLINKIEAALVRGKPVKGWKPLPPGVFV